MPPSFRGGFELPTYQDICWSLRAQNPHLGFFPAAISHTLPLCVIQFRSTRGAFKLCQDIMVWNQEILLWPWNIGLLKLWSVGNMSLLSQVCFLFNFCSCFLLSVLNIPSYDAKAAFLWTRRSIQFRMTASTTRRPPSCWQSHTI